MLVQQWHTCDILCSPSLYHPRECFGILLNLFNDLTASIFFIYLKTWVRRGLKNNQKNKKTKTQNLEWPAGQYCEPHWAQCQMNWFSVETCKGERGEAKEAKMRLCSPTPVWPERSAKVRNDTKSNLMMIGEEPSRKEGKEETPCGRLQRWRTCRAALL